MHLSHGIRILVAAGLVSTVTSPVALSQQPTAAATPQVGAEQATREKAARDTWRKQLLIVPKPKNGCFTAAYPEKTWREIKCKPSTPHKLYLPRRGGMSQIDTVGGGGPTDFSATVTGHISVAEGMFDSVTGVTSTGAYTLQLNSAPFTTSTCSGSPAPANCSGWEQFVYPSGGGAFIQYWLLTYGPAGTMCPTPPHASCAANTSYSDGWCPFQFSPTGSVYCVVNSANEAPAPAAAMTALGTLTLSGAAGSGATNDSIAMTVSGTPYSATGSNYFPDLGTQWQEAEFNVFGDGGGSQATFNPGTSMQVRTEVLSGTTDGPGCHLQSWTGETSNLSLVNSPPPSPAPLPAPALVFSQSNPAAAGAAASCADAVSIGDTHLTTLGGLLYDFQAAGDFTLAEVAPQFEVQARQVSGAPVWPNASVNRAIAARFGNTRVAICSAPSGTDQRARLFVDSKATDVADGTTLLFAGGGGIRRRGNVYYLVGEDGDSVSATLNSYGGTNWIDVKVGLGRWPSEVKGLIANPKGNVNQLATRDDVVLTNPFKFDEFYHHYADSWRVGARTSLLSVCNGDAAVESRIPTQTFYARDLEPRVRERAVAVCNAAGVRPGPMLDACTLDVAVIGQDAAAQVFVGAKNPVAVGTITGGEPGKGAGGSVFKKWWWLLLLLILLFLWLLMRRARSSP